MRRLKTAPDIALQWPLKSAIYASSHGHSHLSWGERKCIPLWARSFKAVRS